MRIRVYYEDTDLGGVVYYANYLKFCERARSELFFQRGLLPYNDDGHFFVKDLHATYIQSAKFADILEISTRLVQMKAASFLLHQEVWKEEQKLFEMDITLVHVDFEGKIKKLSAEEKALISEIFSS